MYRFDRELDTYLHFDRCETTSLIVNKDEKCLFIFLSHVMDDKIHSSSLVGVGIGKKMLTKEFAVSFTNQWIECWNKHDIDQIIAHYDDSIEFVSPFIIQLNQNPTGKITNKNDLKTYFSVALTKYPDLHFQLLDFLVSVDSLIIYYRSVNDLIAAEFFQFDEHGKVTKVMAHYSNKS